MTEPFGIQIEGLEELRRSFDKVSRRGLDKALRSAHLAVAKEVGADVKSAGGSAQQSAAAGAISAAATPTAASIAIANTGAVPFGLGAFLGAVSFAQFPGWVGNAWDIESGAGPYVVAPTIAGDLPRIRERFETEVANALEDLGLDVT